MRIIFNKFDKSGLANLPVEAFEGDILIVENEEDSEKAVDFLLTHDILGVDTETRPSFKKGMTNKVSLLQVSSEDCCFLFRLNKMGIVPSVKRLLEDKKTAKVGLSWHDDVHGLQRRCKFKPGYFVDLQTLVREVGIEDMSLQKIYANIFHKKISKRQQLSNWDAAELTTKQKLYAATDAWACLVLYKEISRLIKTNDYQNVIVEQASCAV